MAAAGSTAAGDTTTVDDFDDFNSFLDTVLSDCDEAAATPTALPAAESRGGDDTNEDNMQLEEDMRDRAGASALADDEITGVSLEPVGMESACITGTVYYCCTSTGRCRRCV